MIMHKLATQFDSRATFYSQLRREIQIAQRVVYQLDDITRLDSLLVCGNPIFAKREDTSRIHSYKWRGSFFKMHQLVEQNRSLEFVAASAGNHAQGVASAAKKLKVRATVFMPKTTPQLKQDAVERLGGDFVAIRLVGDCYDEAANAANDYLASANAVMIKPFDDLSVIAGQATVGLEMMQQCSELTKIYVPIGGGGLASGVAFAVKELLESDCRVIGVEVENQNAMQLSIKCGKPVSLDSVDNFCDGTAVRQPGKFTFEFCSELLDDIVTVSNAQVSGAIQAAWESGRFVPEPSGAIALAAAIEGFETDHAETVGVIISGSNMDFRTFPRVVRNSLPVQTRRRYFRFKIRETTGSLIRLLDQFRRELNIVDFQYGKTDECVAFPVLGIEGPENQLRDLQSKLGMEAIEANEISGSPFSEFRVIPFQPDLCKSPFFLRVDFPNRPGSLRELMRQISDKTNICYFNFVETGELEGHALIGFELFDDDSEYCIRRALFELGLKFQTAKD